MLILRRKRDERTIITVPPSTVPTKIIHTIVDIRGDKTLNGYDAPKSVTIYREEVQREIESEKGR